MGSGLNIQQLDRSNTTPEVTYTYGRRGRRIRKQYFTYTGGWVEQSDVVFLYDGWNLIAELNANSSNAKVRTYVWGTDLSGSLAGAGGVGGLLKVTYYGSTTTNAFVAYDGNGNVAALADAANGTVAARYEYGPFAEPIRVSGSMADAQPIRFSTKYTDRESDLLYYGYRYYNPSTGRWLNRDPLQEEGGSNLYGFVGNDPPRLIDGDGRDIRLIPSLPTLCVEEVVRAVLGTRGMPDSLRHCIVGCKISAWCPPFYCAKAAILKELLDALGLGTPELRDIANTFVGCARGSVPCLKCRACCLRAQTWGILR
jgi:RHS repeat-associated protein